MEGKHGLHSPIYILGFYPRLWRGIRMPEWAAAGREIPPGSQTIHALTRLLPGQAVLEQGAQEGVYAGRAGAELSENGHLL